MILIEALHHISLGSSNLKRSIDFYTEVLGFELMEETDEYALLNMDPVRIRLNYFEGYKSETSNPGQRSLSFILDVDDFTDAIEELESNDIEILKGPVMIEGGEAILVADPDSNMIELFYKE